MYLRWKLSECFGHIFVCGGIVSGISTIIPIVLWGHDGGGCHLQCLCINFHAPCSGFGHFFIFGYILYLII